jgi:hypothetical protein
VAPVPDFDPNDREEIIIDDNDSETAKPVPVFSWNLILGPTPDVYRTEGTIQNAKRKYRNINTVQHHRTYRVNEGRNPM